MKLQFKGAVIMTIYTIAKMAGVSPSTVSKVINNKGNISAATRERVLSLMAQNNFQPHICSNSSNNIAIVYRQSQGNVFESSYTNGILSGISSYFFDKDYNLLLINSEKIPRDRTAFQSFCHRNHIVGAIYIDLKIFDDYVCKIDGVIPQIILNADFVGKEIQCISPDDYQGAYDAMEYLFQMGHSKIAFSILDQDFLSHMQRYNAYRAAYSDYGLTLNPRFVFDDHCLNETAFRMLYDSWKQQNDIPTAIMCSNDSTAVALISYLKTMNVRIPDEISIVGFDDYFFSIHLSPALTTIRQPIFQIGQLAAEKIDQNLHGIHFPDNPHHIFFDEQLIIRHSVQKIGDPILPIR